ncbi:hypothetical protein [Microcoleus sp. AR_TQ3_B6]|uniref:hypothetical protein n=1 Tax=Microcoleus sp. AR_TQ3_B6 TaxID=3055284 RepID=UPI002FD1D5CD
MPFPYKSGGGDVLCAGDRLFWGSAKKFGHGAVPFPYKSGGGDVLCVGDRLFCGRETALPCPLLPPEGDRHFRVGKRHCRVLFCLPRAIDYFRVGKRHCRVLFCLPRAIDILG